MVMVTALVMVRRLVMVMMVVMVRRVAMVMMVTVSLPFRVPRWEQHAAPRADACRRSMR